MPIYIDKTGYILPKDRSYGVKKDVERIMQDVPLMTAAGTLIAGTGAGKVQLLHKVVEKVRGSFSNYVQAIGDCVSFGAMGAIQATYAADIAIRNQAEEWQLDVATEWLYGTSRVIAGKGRLGNSDGSVGSWVAKSMLENGVLFRKPYGQHDLTTYSGKRARDWGYKKLPFDLEPEADLHPVTSMPPLVRSYEEARDCIYNGYAVFVCSNYGFSDKRDSQGFAKKSGSWAHCMFWHGVDDTQRPGLLQQNSWPRTWISGPTRHDQPDGSFWTDAAVADNQIKSGEAFAVPGLNGFVRQNIEWSLF